VLLGGLGDVGDVGDVQRGELGEVTATAAAIGDHFELGAGSYLVQHPEPPTTSSTAPPRAHLVQLGDHRTLSRSPRPTARRLLKLGAGRYSCSTASTHRREPLTTSSRASTAACRAPGRAAHHGQPRGAVTTAATAAIGGDHEPATTSTTGRPPQACIEPRASSNVGTARGCATLDEGCALNTVAAGPAG
jgi:hypothetical protein